MPLDGIVLSSITYELNELLKGARVEKVNQTEKDEIILTCHTFSGKYNLLISANPSNPRMHLTTERKDNPLLAPPFCMVLRKHIKGGKITSIIQSGYDRIVTINFEVFDDLEGATEKKLVVEIMGKYSNIILLGKKDIIFDAIKHIDSSMSSVREILPAHIYAAPPAQNKLSPENTEEIKKAFLSGKGKAKNVLLSLISGFSPMLSISICEMANVNPSADIEYLSDIEKESLWNVLYSCLAQIKEKMYAPRMFYQEGEESPLDFHCIKEANAGTFSKDFESTNGLLDGYFTEKDRVFRLGQKKIILIKKINSAIEHWEKKLEIYRETLSEKASCEKYKLYGELIKSYIYMIPKGAESFTCVNFFDENSAEITVPLDKNLTPASNASYCFKKYRKQKNAIESAEKFFEEAVNEIQYLESVKTFLENCNEDSIISETKEELVKTGYIKPDAPSKMSKMRKQTAQAPSQPLKFVSSEGFEILVGKNNRQNDLLTFKTAAPDDIWFHIKDAPGSHVILKTNNGRVTGRAIEEAASYAAGYSSVKGMVKVPIDYTRVKYVKKPSGAKPGMVIFTNQKTILAVGKNKKQVVKC